MHYSEEKKTKLKILDLIQREANQVQLLKIVY